MHYGIFLATFLVPVVAVLLIGEGVSRARASIRAAAGEPPRRAAGRSDGRA